ncbi:hypothetical protein FRX31_015640 [Thalictrum thalictroides]|uniref:DUF4283 domain-containing protein n=1 Tax=Thalictrum thalictroides TaxID=46969 RepID=A0A7J6WBG6_THATH|nr:hypothetical protein FRX31_015640 [Thalictrum thalictroides]
MKPPPQIDNFAVRNSSSVRVEIKSRGPVTNGEEWARAVICSSTDSEVDWIWVKEKVDSRFPGGCLRLLDNGEAVLMMNTIREAEQIAVFTPLWTERGVVTFRRWRPNEGSLDLVHERVNDFWISFKGIPLHLRNKAVVESLASACGSLIQIDEDSLIFGCGTQRAKLKGEGKRPLPRSVWLEEKSYEFLITVTPENNNSWETEQKTLTGISRAPAPNVGENFSWRGPKQKETDQFRPVSYAHIVASPSLSRPPGFELAKAQNFSPSSVRCVNQERSNGLETQQPQRSNDQVELGPQVIDLRVPTFETPFLLQKEAQETSMGGGDQVRSRTHIFSKQPSMMQQFWANKSQRWAIWANHNAKKRNNRRGKRRSKSKERSLIEKMGSPLILSRKGKEVVGENDKQVDCEGKSKGIESDSIDNSFVPLSNWQNQGRKAIPCSSTPSNRANVDREVVLSTPSREEIMEKLKESLFKCSSEEQIEVWIKWLVMPLAEQLGVKEDGNIDGMEQLYRELCQQDLLGNDQHEEHFGDLPMDDPNEVGEGSEGDDAVIDVD